MFCWLSLRPVYHSEHETTHNDSNACFDVNSNLHQCSPCHGSGEIIQEKAKQVEWVNSMNIKEKEIQDEICLFFSERCFSQTRHVKNFLVFTDHKVTASGLFPSCGLPLTLPQQCDNGDLPLSVSKRLSGDSSSRTSLSSTESIQNYKSKH